MKKLTLIFAAIAICFGFTTNTLAQKKPGGSGSSAVYLNVTVDNGTTEQPNAIRSDNDLFNPYSHGSSSVSAQFTKYGFFDFNSGTRNINAYYSPYEGQSALAPDSGTGVLIKTHSGSQEPTYLQNMPVGSSRCVQMSVTFNFGTYTRTIGYNAGNGTISNTGRVRVTHPNTDTWIIESNSGGICSQYDEIARVRDRTTARPYVDTDYGRFSMPVRIILERKL
jgi:hypothetical protein